MEYIFGLSISTFLQTTGLLGIIGIIFVESGLLVGFFLPGDSLLFTAGFLSSQGFFSIGYLAIGCAIAAIAGDNVGYALGNRMGKKIFNRENSLLFHKEHLVRAKRFYELYGAKTIVFARFLPVIRSFAPVVAGAAEMHYRTFLFYNIIGGTIWAGGFTGLGYFLGSIIPNVDRYLAPLIGAIVVLSFLPPIIHILRERRKNHLI